jgi:pimeloyl-ACP methyl ester carboxylesterase
VLRPDATSGAFGARLDENVPRDGIDVPLFIGQGGADPLVLPEAQAAYAAARCDDGQELEYREYAGADHLGVTTDPTAVADLLEFTEARFAGESWSSGCDAVPAG